MKHYIILFLIFASVLKFNTPCAYGADTKPHRQTVGLVLSGGGAKGIAHIGVIKVLEQNGIPIDYIAGTSMGAIVGGLYAAGYSPEEMMELIESRDFGYWSTGTVNPAFTLYYAQTEPTPALATVNFNDLFNTHKLSLRMPTSLISPLPMNFAFMQLFSPYTAQCGGDFDRLFVPLRTVTSDAYAKHKVVCKSGELGDAIRASMSFPVVFQPTELDSTLMYDGGIYDNFPVGVMHDEFKPDIIIGVDVANHDTKPKTGDLAQQLEDLVIQNNDYSLPDSLGIKIKINLNQYNLLDFGKAEEIYGKGYERAEEMIDSICTRVTVRTDSTALAYRRRRFKDATPKLVFDSVQVQGGNESQKEYVKYLFTRNKPDTFGVMRARDAFYRAVGSGKVNDLMPHAEYIPSDSLFVLHLKGSMNNRLTASAGGFISTGTSGMFYFGARYSTLSLHAVDATLKAWAGQSYLALAAAGQLQLLTPTPSSLMAEAVLSRREYHQSDKLFFQDKEPAFVTHTEMFMRLSYIVACGQRGKLDAGVGYGRLSDKFYPVRSGNARINESGRDRVIRNMAVANVRYQYNTLNSDNFPTTGNYVSANLYGILDTEQFRPADPAGGLRSDTHPKYAMLELRSRNYFRVINRISTGIETELVTSSRKLPHDYGQAVVCAPSFNPTPSSYNAFNPAFRANSFISAGIVPVWEVGSLFQLRGQVHMFMPFRRIEQSDDNRAVYGKWFRSPQFFGEAAAVLTMPVGEVKAYVNYLSSPKSNWNIGVSLGMYILAPRLVR